MPHLEKFSLETLPQNIRDNVKIEGKDIYISTTKLKENGEILGAGGQRFVIPNPENPDKEALAFMYQGELTTEQAKQIYYSQKIMSTLFPHNFPKTYAVTAGSFLGENIPVEIRQRVNGEHPTDINKITNTPKNKIIYLFDSIKKLIQGEIPIKYPYSKVFDFFEKMDLNYYTGDNEGNFINSEDGGQYFVDTLFEYKKDLLSLLNLDQHKLESYLIKNNYRDQDKTRILNALERLKKISQETETQPKK